MLAHTVEIASKYGGYKNRHVPAVLPPDQCAGNTYEQQTEPY